MIVKMSQRNKFFDTFCSGKLVVKVYYWLGKWIGLWISAKELEIHMCINL